MREQRNAGAPRAFQTTGAAERWLCAGCLKIESVLHATSRERRLWHIAGVIRINFGMHRDTHDARRFEAARYECTGLERRGEWNRLLLGRRLDRTVKAEKIIVCTRSSVIGRIQFDASWHGNGIQVLAGSAFRGEQETLLLAAPGAQLQTDAGDWEVLWDGLAKR